MALKNLLVLTVVVLTARAQTTASACQSSIAPQHAAPSVAPGFRVEVVANGLRDPRGILFDSEGGLLVVEQGHGISRLRLTGDGPCVKVEGDVQKVVEDDSVRERIVLASFSSAVVRFKMSPSLTVLVESRNHPLTGRSDSLRLFSQQRVCMGLRCFPRPQHVWLSRYHPGHGDEGGHTTRTLLLSKKVPDLLVVSRGSEGNIDLETLDVTTGVSTIKAFNISNLTNSAYNHASDGLLLGWGLRNSVGVAEEPTSGGIYAVENSVDNIQRSGQTINENNPGEEMNFLGYLNGTHSDVQGKNHGYPTCFAAWNVSEIPDFHGTTGEQFAMGDQNATVNDTFCQNDRIAPRITFFSHMAPLDIKFNPAGTAAWVTFHGSW